MAITEFAELVFGIALVGQSEASRLLFDLRRAKSSYYSALQRDFDELEIVSDILPWECGGALLAHCRVNPTP